jgi:hypothetical protein
MRTKLTQAERGADAEQHHEAQQEDYSAAVCPALPTP